MKIKIANRYGVTPNELLCNREVSAKAKGLYAYIQSKPDDWDFSAERIALEMRDGRDGIQAGLRELETSGYLVRTRFSLGR